MFELFSLLNNDFYVLGIVESIFIGFLLFDPNNSAVTINCIEVKHLLKVRHLNNVYLIRELELLAIIFTNFNNVNNLT